MVRPAISGAFKALRATPPAPKKNRAEDRSGLFDERQPAFNLRGRLAAGPDAGFEVRSVIPGPYRDPPGSLDMASMRPAHIHVRLTHAGFETLTTQLFFAQDPHLIVLA